MHKACQPKLIQWWSKKKAGQTTKQAAEWTGEEANRQTDRLACKELHNQTIASLVLNQHHDSSLADPDSCINPHLQGPLA